MAPLNLDIGLRAILTSQAALETIGHNITNASTPGFSRQTLEVGSAGATSIRGLLIGSGVQPEVVRRVTDTLLNKRLTLQFSSIGRLDSRLNGMVHAETFFGLPGTNGIDTSIEHFFSEISGLASSPSDQILRTGVIQAASQLGARLSTLSSNVSELRGDTISRIDGVVDKINLIGQQISELNREIRTTEAGGIPANDLRDLRDGALKELAELVDIEFAEGQLGTVRVLIEGRMFVSPTRANTLMASSDPSGDIVIELTSSEQAIEVQGGALGGLVTLVESFLPDLHQKVDDLSRNVIFEMNRIHSTGIPSSGSFNLLVGEYGVVDQDGDGITTDELLASAGLPFDLTQGDLYVNVVDETTGNVTKHRVTVDLARTTVGDFITDLGAIDHLTASIDSIGRVQLSADQGFGFDFSRRLVTTPDTVGSFGGGKASLGSGVAGPFALSDGDTLDIVGPLGAFSVTFNSGSFRQISQATASEVADVINADANAQANGITASQVGDLLVIQTAGSGSSESFQVAGGTALTALGLAGGTTVTGSDTAVSAAIQGEYTGSSNAQFSFRPNKDGTVGATAGLLVDVFDQNGNRVASLDVGNTYRPGDELEVVDGIRVTFGFGDLSASHNDVFVLDALSDSDTANVLAALGINSLFTGTGASNIGLRADIEQDPSLLAASMTGAAGDGSVLLELMNLARDGVQGLGGLTFGEHYGDMISGVGLDVSSATSAMETEQFLLDGLEARRDQISGVNVDEELVNLIEYEQAFAAASQYVRIISDLSDVLLAMI